MQTKYEAEDIDLIEYFKIITIIIIAEIIRTAFAFLFIFVKAKFY